MKKTLSPQLPSRVSTRPSKGVQYDRFTERLVFANTADTPLVDAARRSLHKEANAQDKSAMKNMRESMSADVAQKFRDYTPELPAQQADFIRSFVEDAVLLALPLTSYTVETLLRPAMHFVCWAVFVVGADLDANIVFTRKLIEHYVRETMPELTEGTRRNYRAWLFRVAEAANPESNPNNPMPLSQRALEVPYSAAELDALDDWASGQRTPYLRTNARILLALGCGVGLSASEIAVIRKEDIVVDDDEAVHIKVSGKAARTVVASARYEEVLRQAAETVADGAFVFLPKRNSVGNEIVSAFISRTDNPKGTPVLRARKMRNTWLVLHLTNRVDVTTLMYAAGLQSLESISRLAQFVPAIDDAEVAAMLRGTR